MKTFLLVLLLVSISFGQEFNKENSATAFMPKLIKQFPNVRDIAISNDRSEVYFSVQSFLSGYTAIAFVKLEKGEFSKPELTSFSGKYQDLEPFLSADGLRLYFASNRPLSKTENTVKDFDIWFVERQNSKAKWSDPINLGAPINTKHNEFYPSISTSGNLYFTSDPPTSKGKDDIYFAKVENGKFKTPIPISDSINTKGYEFNAFIAPDESYIIYTGYNYAGGMGSGDLYISYNTNGVWSSAQNLGKNINSTSMDYCPFVDNKKQILYFTSKRNTVRKIYNQEQTLSELLDEMHKYENGQSRIYQVPFSN